MAFKGKGCGLKHYQCLFFCSKLYTVMLYGDKKLKHCYYNIQEMMKSEVLTTILFYTTVKILQLISRFSVPGWLRKPKLSEENQRPSADELTFSNVQSGIWTTVVRGTEIQKLGVKITQMKMFLRNGGRKEFCPYIV